MAFKTEILPNLPVIYTQYTGKLSASILEQSMINLPYYIQQIQHPFIFQILDVRHSHIDFKEIMLFFKKLKENRPAWMNETRFEVIFVGANHMVDFSRQLLSKDQFGGLSIPIFKEYDDAITFIQTRLKDTSRK